MEEYLPATWGSVIITVNYCLTKRSVSEHPIRPALPPCAYLYVAFLETNSDRTIIECKDYLFSLNVILFFPYTHLFS